VKHHPLLVAFVSSVLFACGAAHVSAPPPAVGVSELEPRLAPPPDLAPNILRDRRTAPGVRSAATPLVLPGAKKCGKIGRTLEEAQPSRADLLGGRFTIDMPSATRVVTAPDTGEAETRLVVETGDATPPRRGEPSRIEAFAVAARETFQLDPDMYEAEAGAPLVPAKLDVEAAKFLKATFRDVEGLEVDPVEIDGLRAYAARPKAPNAPPGRDTALVLALLVAHSDGMLEQLAFHVRGEFVRNATGSALVSCTRVAEKLAASIARGSRSVDRTPGARVVTDLSTNDKLTVRVPADYVVVPASGGGRIYKLRPLGLFAGSITVAVKSTPDDAALKDADATAAGKLLGRDTTWRGKTSASGGFFFAAAPLEDRRLAEVLVKATRQAKVLDELRGVAETLSVEKRR
jgi:hypothetical protein